MLQPSTFQFLKDLKKNNNKPWFDAHRKNYEAAKEDFSVFVQSIISQFGKKEPSISHLKAKDCLFRINRDVRFSKDKSPYKTNFGAYFNAEGKKSLKAGYYFHFEPDSSFMGGGLWQPTPDVLSKIRQEIDYNFTDFKKILKSKRFSTLYGGLSAEDGQVLSKVPRGYEADNPAAEYLKYKSFVTLCNITDNNLMAKAATTFTVNAFDTLKPFIAFLNGAID